MRRILVAGNWKMHGDSAANAALLAGIAAGIGQAENADVLVCPPFPYLAATRDIIAGGPVVLGAQNLCTEAQGAYTGEVSGAMLADVGCEFVIVGHSERRAIYAETSATVAAKFGAAQAAGLTPILCMGETLAEREAGRTEAVIAEQLGAVLDTAGVDALERSVLAYEPVWAIGTGKTASPEQAQSVHAFIRATIAAKNDRIAGSLRVLYGGSVKPGNAAELFAMPDVDGGLIGGASLKAEDFLGICAAAR